MMMFTFFKGFSVAPLKTKPEIFLDWAVAPPMKRTRMPSNVTAGFT